MKSQKQ